MQTLHDQWVEQKDIAGEHAQLVLSGVQRGLPYYESLVIAHVAMANCIHDYVYNVTNPFDSMMTRNVVREAVCEEMYAPRISQ
jgi:hypothetical protein